jgi:hypothetical protein
LAPSQTAESQPAEPPVTYGYLQTVAAPIWLSTATGELQALYVDHATRCGVIETLPLAELVTRWPLATISSGRLFNQGSEWRWQPDARTADRYALLGLSEDETQLAQAIAQVAAPAIVQTWSVTKSRLHLIGSIVQPPSNHDSRAELIAQHCWHEVRNPNPLLYPVANNGDRNRQPRLVVQVYARPSTGAVVHTRYSHFETENVTPS